MVKSIAKSSAWIRDLKEKLEFRFEDSATIDTISEAKDANGFSYLMLSLAGAVAAGDEVIFIRILGQDAVSKDVFGNDNYSFTPHVMEFAYELDGAVPEPKQLDIFRAIQESLKLGIKVQIKEVADGTAVTPANVSAAAVALEIEPEIQWPQKGM